MTPAETEHELWHATEDARLARPVTEAEIAEGAVREDSQPSAVEPITDEMRITARSFVDGFSGGAF